MLIAFLELSMRSLRKRHTLRAGTMTYARWIICMPWGGKMGQRLLIGGGETVTKCVLGQGLRVVWAKRNRPYQAGTKTRPLQRTSRILVWCEGE